MIGDGNFISQVPLFGGLDDAQQVSLQQKMGHTTLRRGETLFDEGDLGDIVKSLGGDDAAVPSSDNGDARHVCPSDSQYSQRCSQWRVDVLSR